MAFVTIQAGRPPERIRAMISAVTAAIAESLDAPAEAIRVVVTEVPQTHWATGDVTLAEKAGRPATEARVPASGKPVADLDPGGPAR